LDLASLALPSLLITAIGGWTTNTIGLARRGDDPLNNNRL